MFLFLSTDFNHSVVNMSKQDIRAKQKLLEILDQLASHQPLAVTIEGETMQKCSDMGEADHRKNQY